MKNKLQAIIDQKKAEIYALGDDLFKTPELGFKEFKTKSKIIDYLNKYQIKVEKEYCETGFQVSIGSGLPHIGLLAELDAIPTPDHPFCDPVSNAAHSCGHSTQVTIMLAALVALQETKVLDHFPGKVTLYFTPAEEFTDIAYRRELISQGKIKYLSGKENMLVDHVFDDVDLIIHLHASGEYQGYRFGVNSTLAGFIYKTFTFTGKAAHAAVLPDKGVNALNAFALFQSAVAMLRETFKEEDMIRVHGIITHGGDTVNTIPDRVVYEGYVRSANPQTLLKINERLTDCAKHSAMAIGAKCHVKDTAGYLPLIQDERLSEVIYQNMLKFTTADQIKNHEVSVAAGDVGDISVFKPIIQYAYTGFTGTMHGKTLLVTDQEEVYLTQAKLVAMTVYDLLSNPALVENIKKTFKPTMTYAEYLTYLGNQ